jgi:hypothetical protein
VRPKDLKEPVSDYKTVKAALGEVVSRATRPDGWATGSFDDGRRYVTGIPAYEMWAEALETGRARRDGEAYLNVVWLECRQMAVEFLKEAKSRLSGVADLPFDAAIAYYTVVREKLQALSDMHPERSEGLDWTTTFVCIAGAALVREASDAERRGVAALEQILGAL